MNLRALKEYSPKKFIGLDVHKEIIAIVVLDEQGKVLVQSAVATDGETICSFLKGLSGEIHLTFEVGTQSNWLYRQTKPLVEKVVGYCCPIHKRLYFQYNNTISITFGGVLLCL